MRIGGSLLLIAIGAILKFAVADAVDGVDLGTVGIILMVVGVVGLIISLVLMTRRQRTDVVHQPAPVVTDQGYGPAGGRTTYVQDRDPRI